MAINPKWYRYALKGGYVKRISRASNRITCWIWRHNNPLTRIR